MWGWIALAAFFGGWIGWAVYAKRRGWSGTIAYAGGFIAGVLATIVVSLPFKPSSKDQQAEQAASTLPAIPLKDHNYVMQDGLQYGYPAAISADARQSGQVAETLVMVYYAGERDGKMQAHIMDGMTVTAIECARPCDYIKIMTYIDNEYLRDQIKVERIAAAPGSVGYLIMEDAMNGKLRQYGRGVAGKQYSMWVDEQKGMQRFPLVEPPVSRQ